MRNITASTKETEELAKIIAGKLIPGDVLALHGDLGAGKTTFTRYLSEALGITKRVQSPTFVIVRRYTNDGNSIIHTMNHIDLYRLKDENELQDIGLEEILEYPDSVSVIEWPELAGRYLIKAKRLININISIIDEDRREFDVQGLY